MAQYRPEYKACEFPELCRRVTGREYADAVDLAIAACLGPLPGNPLMPGRSQLGADDFI